MDTVGLLALWDQADQWHEAAAGAYDRLQLSRVRLLTTTYVMLECGNAAARRPYRRYVDVLRRRYEEAGALILPTRDVGERRGRLTGAVRPPRPVSWIRFRSLSCAASA